MIKNDTRQALLKDEGASDASRTQGDGMQDSYSAEFHRLRDSVSSKLAILNGAGADVSASKGEEEVKAIEQLIKDLEANRRQVQVQVRLDLSSLGGSKKSWDDKLATWANDEDRLRLELKSAKENQQRRALSLSHGPGDWSASLSDRARAEDVTDQLNRSTQQIEEARRLAAESENIGEGILSDLAQQRETICRTRSNLRVAGEELSASRRALDRMGRFARQNRVAVAFLVFVICIALLILAFGTFGVPLKTSLLIAGGIASFVGLVKLFTWYRSNRVGNTASAGTEMTEGTSFLPLRG